MSKGTVLIETDRCKGCALCVSVCPQHVLRLGEGYNARGYHPVELDESAGSCTGCAICAVMCPDVVFTVLRSPAPARPAARTAPPKAGEAARPALQPLPILAAAHEEHPAGRRNGHAPAPAANTRT